MTSETRTFIEASDVFGIEIGCPKCNLAIFYPITVERVIEIGSFCPHCNHPFFDVVKDAVYPGRHYPAVDALQEIAAGLRKLTNPERTDIHANIRFRLAEPKAKA